LIAKNRAQIDGLEVIYKVCSPLYFQQVSKISIQPQNLPGKTGFGITLSTLTQFIVVGNTFGNFFWQLFLLIICAKWIKLVNPS
jgi:hypothetical protein